jgi:hypothetical protein
MPLVAGFPQRRAGYDPRSGHVGFVVDKAARGQIFSEYFGFSIVWLEGLSQLKYPITSSGIEPGIFRLVA